MRINYTPKVIQSVKNYKSQVNKAEMIQPNKMKSDKIEISSSAREFQIAFSEIKKLPETREARVAQLKEQVNNGTYRVDSGKIAEAILNAEKFEDS